MRSLVLVSACPFSTSISDAPKSSSGFIPSSHSTTFLDTHQSCSGSPRRTISPYSMRLNRSVCASLRDMLLSYQRNKAGRPRSARQTPAPPPRSAMQTRHASKQPRGLSARLTAQLTTDQTPLGPRLSHEKRGRQMGECQPLVGFPLTCTRCGGVADCTNCSANRKGPEPRTRTPAREGSTL